MAVEAEITEAKVVVPEEVPTMEIIQTKLSLKLLKKPSLIRRVLSTQTYPPTPPGRAPNIGRRVAKVLTVVIHLYASGKMSSPHALQLLPEKLASLVIQIQI